VLLLRTWGSKYLPASYQLQLWVKLTWLADSTCIVVHLMLMRIVVLLMLRGCHPICSPDLAGVSEVLRGYYSYPFNSWILQNPYHFLSFFKCNKMLVALRLASIDFILFDTVQLVWIRAAPVVVNHIPLSKRITVLCGSVLFICTDAIWRITCLYPQSSYLHRLARNSRTSVVYSLNHGSTHH
jgi:hypothetical protein